MISNAIMLLFPGIDFIDECKLQDDGNGPYIAEWNRPEPQPTQAEIDAAIPLAKLSATITAIKAECQRRIYARYPIESQSNLNARANELNDIRFERPLTEEEDAQRMALKGIFAWIKATRIYSNTLETMAATNPDLDITVGWPE